MIEDLTSGELNFPGDYGHGHANEPDEPTDDNGVITDGAIIDPPPVLTEEETGGGPFFRGWDT